MRPTYGEDFVDREELLVEMVEALSSPRERMGFALVGRRRMGKTSVFLEVVRRLDENPRVIPVYLSLWDLVEGTLGELAQSLVRETLERFQERGRLPLTVRARNLLSAPLDLLREVLDGVRISVRLRREIEILLLFSRGEERPSAADFLERAVLFPENLARETGVRCVLFLDEFPTLMEVKHAGQALGEGAVRKLRTLYERIEHTVLSISGSMRGTMEAVALSPAAAFWRQFVVREVGPLPKPAVDTLLSRNLGQRVPAEALEALWEFTHGIPFYVQFLGRELARLGGKVTAEAVAQAGEEFLREEGDLLFREEWTHLAPKERKVAMALAQGHSAPTAIAQAVGDTPNVVSRYLLYLEKKGLAERSGRGDWVLTDPVLARWLARQGL
ncbi:ATP-binding protein [Candidatus Bipolaricaulota bacterium]|nr:ATP-binding protein [Candidatus Bipolaricaulota bacterium]